MNKILLITKNDFEGMASAILLKYILAGKIDIQFYNYKAHVVQYQEEAVKYESVMAVGLKNSKHLQSISNLLICDGFEELFETCQWLYPEDCDNNTLNIFKKNVSAYIDWSWSEKKLYFGKNIDELSKHLGKEEIIDRISNRISKEEEIVTNVEKEMLIFVKKIMTNNIQNKKYEIIIEKGKRFAVTYAEMYEIELANHILSLEKDIDAVVIFNMTTKIARIKTAKGVDLEKNIINAGGLTNSNGGTIKFGTAFDKTIQTSILNKL